MRIGERVTALGVALVMALALAVSACGVESSYPLGSGEYFTVSAAPLGIAKGTYRNGEITVPFEAYVVPAGASVTAVVLAGGEIRATPEGGYEAGEPGQPDSPVVMGGSGQASLVMRMEEGRSSHMRIFSAYLEPGAEEAVETCTVISKDYYDVLAASEYMELTLEALTTLPLEPIDSYQVNNWAREQVREALEKGLVPEDLEADLRVSINRAEFAAVAVTLYEALGGEEGEEKDCPFTDTEDPYVRTAYSLGLVNGTGDGTTYSPAAPVTREQMAALLSNVYTRLGHELPKALPQAEAAAFADGDAVAAYARDAVAFMAEKGILTGMGENRFMPKNGSTREQALILALRMAEMLK